LKGRAEGKGGRAMNTRSWLPWLSPPTGASRRRCVCRIPEDAEVCEERILLSASVPMSGQSRSGSTSPRVVHSPSTGGPNGTVFLSPVLTPANPVEVPGTAIAALPDSLAPVVTSFDPLTPAPTVPASLSGNVPTSFSPSIDQTFGPPSGQDIFTAGSGSSSTSANNTGSASNTGVGTVSQYAGMSLMEPLPSMDLDLAFTPAIDLTAPSVWS
jgi:hypothetical protein